MVTDVYWGFSQLVLQQLARAQVLLLTSVIWSRQGRQGTRHAYLTDPRLVGGGGFKHRAGNRLALLNVAVMEGRHTAHKIQEALGYVLKQWSLATEKQGLFVIDSGANKHGGSIAGWEDERNAMCGPHSWPSNLGYFAEYDRHMHT